LACFAGRSRGIPAVVERTVRGRKTKQDYPVLGL